MVHKAMIFLEKKFEFLVMVKLTFWEKKMTYLPTLIKYFTT